MLDYQKIYRLIHKDRSEKACMEALDLLSQPQQGLDEEAIRYRLMRNAFFTLKDKERVIECGRLSAEYADRYFRDKKILDVGCLNELCRTMHERLAYHGKNDTDIHIWIDVVDGVLYSTNNDGKHKEKKDRYCVSTSPFWYYAKTIWEQLPGTSEESQRWMENIAWSNLFKVAPQIKGNPPREYIDAQKEVCNEILYYEMEILKPTHILFMTGYDWFKDFAGCFEDIKHLGYNKTGKNKNDVYVEATAKFHGVNVVVTCRPEYRKKDSYVQSATNMLLK